MRFISDILDDLDVDTAWHKHRIAFMAQMVGRLDIVYFAPATREQVSAFVKSAVDFWDGKITKQDAKRIYGQMKTLLGKKDVTKWDWHSFLLWMIEEEEHFDWMWQQWFECIADCIYNRNDEPVWLELLTAHFSPEIAAWVHANEI